MICEKLDSTIMLAQLGNTKSYIKKRIIYFIRIFFSILFSSLLLLSHITVPLNDKSTNPISSHNTSLNWKKNKTITAKNYSYLSTLFSHIQHCFTSCICCNVIDVIKKNLEQMQSFEDRLKTMGFESKKQYFFKNILQSGFPSLSQK